MDNGKGEGGAAAIAILVSDTPTRGLSLKRS